MPKQTFRDPLASSIIPVPLMETHLDTHTHTHKKGPKCLCYYSPMICIVAAWLSSVKLKIRDDISKLAC